MAKSKKDRTDWVITKGQLARWQKDQQRQRQIIIIVSIIIAVVIALLIYAIASETTSDNPTVLTVSGPLKDTSFNMNYYVDMLQIYGTLSADPSEIFNEAKSVLSMMESNEIYRQLATTMNISASEEEIDSHIRNSFATIIDPGTGTSTGTPPYEQIAAQLRQSLDRQGVPFERLREVMTAEILRSKIQESIQEELVPSEAEQVHVQGILIDTSFPVSPGTPADSRSPSFDIPETIDLDETVETIKSRLNAGETFDTLALEYSRDFTTNQDGGDLGWFPRGVLTPPIEAVAFVIEPFTLSDPIPSSDEESNTSYWLIRVIDKDEARPIEESHRQILESRAFMEWFEQQTLSFVSEIKIDDSGIQDAITKAMR